MSFLNFLLNYWISITSGLLVGLISQRPMFSYKTSQRLQFKQVNNYTATVHHHHNYPIQASKDKNSQSSSNPIISIFFILIIMAVIVSAFSLYKDYIILWGWRIEFFVLTCVVTVNIIRLIRHEHNFEGIMLILISVLSVAVFYKFTNFILNPEYINYLDEVAAGSVFIFSPWNHLVIQQVSGLFILLIPTFTLLIQSIVYMFPSLVNQRFRHIENKLFRASFFLFQTSCLLFAYILVSGYIGQLINLLNPKF